MTREDDTEDVVLGRTLGETARLNSPESRAGRAGKAAVRRSQPDAARRASGRRSFRIGMLIFALLVLLTTVAAALLRPE